MRSMIQAKWIFAILIVAGAGLLVSAVRLPAAVDVQFLVYDRTSFTGAADKPKKEIQDLLERGFDLHAVVNTGTEPAGQILVFRKK